MTEEIIKKNNPKPTKPLGELIDEFAEIRTFLSAERKKFKELEANLKSDMELLEVEILSAQRGLGLTTTSSARFTAFQTAKESVRMGDWDKFIGYVEKSKNFQMLEKRCAKLACLEVKEDGVSLDEIGLDYSKEIVVQIRKR